MTNQTRTVDPATGEIGVSLGAVLLTSYAMAEEALELAKETRERIFLAIIQEIQAQGPDARVLDPDDCPYRFEMGFDYPTPRYDPAKLIPLKEKLSDANFKITWDEEYIKETKVPAKFNAKLAKVCRDLGGEVAAIYDGAKLEGKATGKLVNG